MEPTAITTKAPVKVTRLALYLAIVAAMAFFNCAFLKAATPEEEIRLENEKEISLEDWMIDNSELIAESDVHIEDWMIDNSQLITDSSIRLEPWMISTDNDIIVQAEVEVEDWMIDGSSLSKNNFLVRK